MKSLLLLYVLASTQLAVAQTQTGVDFLKAVALIEVLPEEGLIIGEVDYDFRIIKKSDSIYLDARHMDILEVTLDNDKVPFLNDGSRLVIHQKFKPKTYTKLHIKFKAQPDEAVYFIGWDNPYDTNKQVWTQGQGKYTSHWLPSLDDMNDKIEFDLAIAFRPGYTVLANGVLTARVEKDDKVLWKFDMDRPMSSYLAAFAIGAYEVESLKSNSGVTINNYYYPEDRHKAEPTYRFTARIMDILEQEIGIPYPWKIYKQAPVRDFLYAGMENTGLTLFSDQYVVDSIALTDKSYVNINAHEMVHQWFGNLVTEKDASHHWLHEGFATYYALLAEKKIYGMKRYSWELFRKAQMLHSLSEEGEGEALTDPGASSITFYDKGAWAVAILRHRIGEDTFKKGVGLFLESNAYDNVTIDDFLGSMEKVSGIDLDGFADRWLNEADFQMDEAMEYLVSINPEFKMVREFKAIEEAGETGLELMVKNGWENAISPDMKCFLVRKYSATFSDDFIRQILGDPDVKVRQTMLLVTDRIPAELKRTYEGLLDDPSYITREYALFNLWVNYLEDRERYLDKLAGIKGMPDHNVVTLWLVLASVTEGYADLEVRMGYIDRLRDFTNPVYSPETRQRAFSLIEQAGFWADRNYSDLILATTHHQWQFRQWARKLTDRLWQDEETRKRMLEVSKKLKEEDLRYISTKSIHP